jgi:hypothetical protein
MTVRGIIAFAATAERKRARVAAFAPLRYRV